MFRFKFQHVTYFVPSDVLSLFTEIVWYSCGILVYWYERETGWGEGAFLRGAGLCFSFHSLPSVKPAWMTLNKPAWNQPTIQPSHRDMTRQPTLLHRSFHDVFIHSKSRIFSRLVLRNCCMMVGVRGVVYRQTVAHKVFKPVLQRNFVYLPRPLNNYRMLFMICNVSMHNCLPQLI